MGKATSNIKGCICRYEIPRGFKSEYGSDIRKEPKNDVIGLIKGNIVILSFEQGRGKIPYIQGGMP